MTQINKKILLVGGGTGGHVTPLIAVIEELISTGIPANQIFLVTDFESAKMEYAQGHQVEVHTIVSGKFNRFFTLSNIITPFKVIWGFFQSLKLLRKIKPDVILAKGAYLSAPLVYAGAKLKIPIYLHESDSIMGTTNEKLSKYATKIFVSYPIDYYRHDLMDKLVFSGLPIRKRFFEEQPVDMGSSNNKKILVWGGSQGADRLNRLVIAKLSDYLKNFELYHICGPNNFEYCEQAKQNINNEDKNKYHLYAFLGREIEKIIAGSDLIISRAGATSLFELAAMSKAVIAIPYPISASNHQHKNAQYFKNKDAVILLEEENLDEDRLKNIIYEILGNDEKRSCLERNINKLAPKSASKIIVNYLLK